MVENVRFQRKTGYISETAINRARSLIGSGIIYALSDEIKIIDLE